MNRQSNEHKPPLAALAAVAAVALASSAPGMGAAEAAPPPVAVVAYGDLNLYSREGMEVLQRRLERAARQVCGRADLRDLTRSRAVERCYRETLEGALRDLDRLRPALLGRVPSTPPR